MSAQVGRAAKAANAADAALITGADGYLGLRLASRYLETTAHPVFLWVRANGESEIRSKQERLRTLLGRFRERVHLLFGDLGDAEPFAAVDPAGVRTILHAAAATRFSIDQETADRVNLGGTRKLLDFARRCPGLQRLGLLSTLYVSGLTPGRIEEKPILERPVFANHYERSKWEAEAALLAEGDSLPWQIHRVATVIADDESGAVTQQNAFHNTLKLLYHGLLSLIPGKMDTPVYLVTGKFAADAVVTLMSDGESRSVFHVAHSRPESLTLGELMDVAFDTFALDDGFRNRRILRPLFADEESFELLVAGVRAFGGGVVNQAVASVAPFAKQLFVCKEIENRRLVAALRGYRAPDARELAERVCNHLVRTRWGKEATLRAAG